MCWSDRRMTGCYLVCCSTFLHSWDVRVSSPDRRTDRRITMAHAHLHTERRSTKPRRRRSDDAELSCFCFCFCVCAGFFGKSIYLAGQRKHSEMACSSHRTATLRPNDISSSFSYFGRWLPSMSVLARDSWHKICTADMEFSPLPAVCSSKPI